MTTPSAHISTVTLEGQISTARSNVHDDVNAIDDHDIDQEGPESCDEVDDEEDSDDCESHLQEFNAMMDNFKQKVKDKWDEPTFKRAFKSFKNNFRKTLDNDNENTLIRIMFQFARENSQNMNVGRKRKHGSRISVQSTAIARRTHRAIGRSVASYGRKEAVQEKRKQMNINEDDDDIDGVYYSLPSSNTHAKKQKKTHSLGTVITDNTSCARKHDKTMF